MWPTLVQIGPIAISSLGFCLFMAYVLGAFCVWQKGKEENFDAEPLMDGVIGGSLSALVGARLFFGLFTPNLSLKAAINFFKYPGFSYFGALAGFVGFFIYFSWRQKWNFWKLADVLVFGVVPAQILVRFGNFLDGSYYGGETKLFWGLSFPGLESRVHPLNLYELIFLVFLFYLIKKLERQYRLYEWYKDRRGEAAPGFLALTYLLLYSVFRFLLEFLKTSSLYWKGLAWEQWLAAALVLVSFILFYSRSGKGGQESVNFGKRIFRKIWPREKGPKLEVLVPTPQRKPVAANRPFHYKAGMEAKK